MTTTDFLDPGRLWLLLVPLGLVVLYVVVLRWRGRAAVRFTQVDCLLNITGCLGGFAPDSATWSA